MLALMTALRAVASKLEVRDWIILGFLLVVIGMGTHNIFLVNQRDSLRIDLRELKLSRAEEVASYKARLDSAAVANAATQARYDAVIRELDAAKIPTEPEALRKWVLSWRRR